MIYSDAKIEDMHLTKGVINGNLLDFSLVNCDAMMQLLTISNNLLDKTGITNKRRETEFMKLDLYDLRSKNST